MSELNKSYTSGNDDSKVITIQDTGFLIQLPGFFRGKPHFVAYNEIKHDMAFLWGLADVVIPTSENLISSPFICVFV